MTDEFRPAEILAGRLRSLIASEGPLPVSVFMAEALFDPVAGFYATKDPLGADKDFITAPEISQMFGELAGLWAAECWRLAGAPSTLQLVELGPGTGRMMSDALRAGRAAPGFLKAVQVTLVEASPALKMVQGRTLANAPAPVRWASTLEEAPGGASIILANEFLDCLPIRQAIRVKGVWRERCVGLHPQDPERFVFVLGPVLGPGDIGLIPETLRESADGELVELRPADALLIETIKARFEDAPGYALFIDYGSGSPSPGDTLQAIRRHGKVDPLDAPGTADLTAWADFANLRRLAGDAGLQVFGPAGQGAFLGGLGIGARAAALARGRGEAEQARIERQLHRLTAPEEMGTLFKVMAFAAPGLPAPPGFDA